MVKPLESHCYGQQRPVAPNFAPTAATITPFVRQIGSFFCTFSHFMLQSTLPRFEVQQACHNLMLRQKFIMQQQHLRSVEEVDTPMNWGSGL